MTQKQIESFQERTAVSEEISEMYKDVTVPCNSKCRSTESHLNYLNSDSKNTLATTHHIFTFEMERHFTPGKPSSEGVWLHNKQNISCKSNMKNGKCSICKNNQAKYAYKNDIVILPFKIRAETKEGVLVPGGTYDDYECKFLEINTLCKDCILNFKLENTTYIQPVTTAAAPASGPSPAALAAAALAAAAPAIVQAGDVATVAAPAIGFLQAVARARSIARGRGVTRRVAGRGRGTARGRVVA